MPDASTPQPPPEHPRLTGLDGGPIYTETPQEIRDGQPYSGLIAEPWNAATAFLFVVIVIVWLIRLGPRLLKYPFMAVSLPILLVGGIGGTLYHGLRNWSWYFRLDVFPIYFLGMMLSIYFWIRLGPKIRYLVAMIAVLALIQVFGFLQLPRVWAINVSYAMLALLILVPLAVVLVRTRCRYVGWVISALVAFGIAWFCRLADNPPNPPLLPMGTHWLWHTFGAITTAALTEYVYRLEGVSLRQASTSSKSA